MRRDALLNYERILDAARDVFGESGANACMEDIATRAGVGVGTVYRRFACKDALIDELLKLAVEQLKSDAERALVRTDGYGLHELLAALGQSFADHASYANLLLERQPDATASGQLQAAMAELTNRAVSAGTVARGTTVDDVIALSSALRGLIQATRDPAPQTWLRFLDIHLAGLRTGPAADRRPS